MGLRGPKSENHSTVTVLYGKRPKPPSYLSKLAKKVWRQIVDSLPPDRFRTWELDLLAAYCVASSVHRDAVSIIEREGCTIKIGLNGYEAVHPGVNVMNKEAALMSTLATKLRLTPHSRITAVKAGSEKEVRRNTSRRGLLFGDKDPDKE